jgi:hypothetical protein
LVSFASESGGPRVGDLGGGAIMGVRNGFNLMYPSSI